MRTVALIPARAGSMRAPGKNIRLLGGHPAIAYTIAAAQVSDVFFAVAVSTDDERTAAIARHYGADVIDRPADLATAASPDIDWVLHALRHLMERGTACDAFAILRPTSPFRTAATIRRAYGAFTADPQADSLRAVELCAQHPAKMWRLSEQGRRMTPVLAGHTEDGTPWHSSPYQSLPRIYVQNASLELAHTRVATEQGSIAGRQIVPFVTEGHEGFDINGEADWREAERLVSTGETVLQPIPTPPFGARMPAR